MTLHQPAPTDKLCGYCEFRHVGPHVPLPAYCVAHGRALPCRGCATRSPK